MLQLLSGLVSMYTTKTTGKTISRMNTRDSFIVVSTVGMTVAKLEATADMAALLALLTQLVACDMRCSAFLYKSRDLFDACVSDCLIEATLSLDMIFSARSLSDSLKDIFLFLDTFPGSLFLPIIGNSRVVIACFLEAFAALVPFAIQNSLKNRMPK
jgi:hypothetical protein